MNTSRLERRVEALEGRHMTKGIACVLRRSDETVEEAEARWIAENGPFDGREPWIISLIDAAL